MKNRAATRRPRNRQRRQNQIQGTQMLKLIAILTGCCLTLAVSLHAADPTDQVDKKKQPKPRANPKQQQTVQKQQQFKTPNANLQNRRVNKPVVNTPNTTVH